LSTTAFGAVSGTRFIETSAPAAATPFAMVSMCP